MKRVILLAVILFVLVAVLVPSKAAAAGFCGQWTVGCNTDCNCEGCNPWYSDSYLPVWLDEIWTLPFTDCFRLSPWNCAWDAQDCCKYKQINVSYYDCSPPHDWRPTTYTKCCNCYEWDCWSRADLRAPPRDLVYYARKVLGFFRGSNRAA